MPALSQAKQNLVPNDPSLADLLNLLRKDINLNLNCHAIATIATFNPALQTATATVNYKKTSYQPNPLTGSYEPVLSNYPVLIDCPVICLGGGNGSLTFPIRTGDECLVIFNDRDIDNWFQGNSNASTATNRLHSFSDGLILVGIRSLAKVIPTYSPTSVELRNGLNKLSIGISGQDIVISVGTALTVTFKAAGGVHIENAIGTFDFMNDADIEFDTGTVQGLFGSGGKVKFLNGSGTDLVASLVTLLTTATAAGFPLILDPTALAALQSYKP